MWFNKGKKPMVYEKANKALYDRYEKVLDSATDKQKQVEELDTRLSETRASVDLARAKLLTELEQLNMELNEYKTAMQVLGESDGS